MSVKKFTFIIGVVIIIAIAIGLFIFSSTKPSTNNEDEGFFNNLFPFGDTVTERERGTDTDTEDPVIRTEDLFNSEGFLYGQISKEPVAGAVWIEKTEDSPEIVRYAERATGHIYDFDMETISSSRTTNTTVPKLYRALFTNSATKLIGQYLKDNSTIETFSSDINKETGEVVETSLLDQNIQDLEVSPDEDNLVYVINNTSGSRILLSDTLNRTVKEVYSSRFSEWLVSWINGSNVLISTKPSGLVEGFVYKLNINSGNISKLITQENGLLASVSPSEKYILYSHSLANKKVGLFLKNTSSGDNTFLPISTFPEKCVWSPNETYIYCAVPVSIPSGVYPDDWYKGKTLFSDEVWVIETSDGNPYELFAPNKEGYTPVDATELKLSKSGDFLLFKNKIDLTLWGLRVGGFDINESNQETSRN